MGNLPIVRRTGGLVKVKDGVTGFCYVEQSPEELAWAIKRAFKVFREEPEKRLKMVRQAVANIYEHYTWDKVRERYLELYGLSFKKLSGI